MNRLESERAITALNIAAKQPSKAATEDIPNGGGHCHDLTCSRMHLRENNWTIVE
jgi:hypothetical protein